MTIASFRAAPRGVVSGLLAACVLAACASSPSASRPKTLDDKLAERGYKLGGDIDRIQNWSIDGWSYIDDEHVVFNAGPSRDYLVTVLMPCNGLSSANTIGFSTTVSAVTKFDKLVVRNTGFTDQCPIRELHELKRVKKAS
ncbi:DUF6491 family protein [Solimonas soli]|uniref:DUF6491 family protein n=1 Tax=Solimonas soli TaxID=413479 RepID=UPI0004823A16|nr:DUF6491 family protein [Solimonas soli]